MSQFKILGTVTGRSTSKLSNLLEISKNLSKAEVKKLIKQYEKTYPGIVKLRRKGRK